MISQVLQQISFNGLPYQLPLVSLRYLGREWKGFYCSCHLSELHCFWCNLSDLRPVRATTSWCFHLSELLTVWILFYLAPLSDLQPVQVITNWCCHLSDPLTVRAQFFGTVCLTCHLSKLTPVAAATCPSCHLFELLPAWASIMYDLPTPHVKTATSLSCDLNYLLCHMIVSATNHLNCNWLTYVPDPFNIKTVIFNWSPHAHVKLDH